jgi:methionyl-tRNA formyltransferase
MGSKALGLRVLKEMHALAPSALAGAMTFDDTGDSRSVFRSFQQFSRETGVSLHLARNRDHSEEILRDVKPELCLVAGWYWLIRPAALDLVPRGCIGIHYSALPRYRGGSPLVWQLINGEREIGFSFFSLTRGIDEGPVWIQGTVPVGADDYVADVLARLEEKAIEALRQNYLPILNGSLRPRDQDHRLATHCKQRHPEDGNVDWRKPAERVARFIRAQSRPYPGAFTYAGPSLLRLWRARPSTQEYAGFPGQVTKVERGAVHVVCGDGKAVILEEAELDGVAGDPGGLIPSPLAKFSPEAS